MTISRTFTRCAARAQVVLIALAAQLLAVSAHAGRAQGGASEAIEAIRAASAGADLIVVLDDGAGQRRSDAGKAMTGLLAELGLGRHESDLARAWAELAGVIGLGNARAFDDLFGRRMILISERTTFHGFGSWAIATVVPTPMALDVIKKLGAKGREIEAGQTLFAIEGGAFRVTLLKPRGAVAADTHRLVIFSPRDSGDLLRRLVRGMIDPKHWKPVVGEGKRPPPSINAAFLAANAEVARLGIVQADTGWRGQARFELPDFTRRSAGWAGDEFSNLSEDAWLSVADETDLAQLADSPIAAILPIDPDRLRELARHCTGRVYLRVAPRGEHGADLSIGLEMRPSPEAAALADRAARDIAGLLTAAPETVPDYLGFMPQAVRTAPIRGEFADQVLRPMIGPNPAIAWRTGLRGSSSWWITRIAPGASGHTPAFDKLLADLPEGDKGGRLVSLGVLRPGPVAGMVERGAAAGNTLSATLGRIESVRWSTRQRGTQVEIGFDVRMDTASDSPEPPARQQSGE